MQANYEAFDYAGRMNDRLDRIENTSYDSPSFISEDWDAKDIIPGTTRTPHVEILETERSIIANFELPGVKKRDIEVNVTENSIEVIAQKFAETETMKPESYAYSSASEQYYKLIPLPVPVKADESRAIYKDGILKVEVPKQKMKNKKKVRVF